MVAKIVILDRDGVINHDSPDFIKSSEEWVPIDGSLEAIALLSRHGYQIYVATNQSGVARGKLNETVLRDIHGKMLDMVREAGGELSGIVYCPHHPDEHCECRKPKPGLLHKIETLVGTSLAGQPFVGDSPRDIQAARSANCEPILVLTGNGRETHKTHPDITVFSNLLAFAEYIINL